MDFCLFQCRWKAVCLVTAMGPVSLTVFARNSNSMETSPCHISVAGHQIATNICTCHDSTAVVPCTKFCSDHWIRIEVRVERNFHRVWIAMEKPLVKRGPGRVDASQHSGQDDHEQLTVGEDLDIYIFWWLYNILLCVYACKGYTNFKLKRKVLRTACYCLSHTYVVSQYHR